jgi:formamidopyrimidine-DNA glycosylase
MPELPEVEFAAGVLRRAVEGRTIAAVRVLHAAHARRLGTDAAARLRQLRVERVTRRGKHQLLHLSDGSTVHVHFRMTGDWTVGRSSDPEQRHARVVFDFEDGTRVTLDDPRALSTVTVHAAGVDPLPALGPEATDPALNGTVLGSALARRRGPIKTALLDQRVVAGLGNIYVVEALWFARIDPRTVASSLNVERRRRLVAGIRRALAKGSSDPSRYGREGSARFNVYDREGLKCRRCGGTVRRILQAQRSTYFCGKCQRR